MECWRWKRRSTGCLRVILGVWDPDLRLKFLSWHHRGQTKGNLNNEDKHISPEAVEGVPGVPIPEKKPLEIARGWWVFFLSRFLPVCSMVGCVFPFWNRKRSQIWLWRDVGLVLKFSRDFVPSVSILAQWVIVSACFLAWVGSNRPHARTCRSMDRQREQLPMSLRKCKKSNKLKL